MSENRIEPYLQPIVALPSRRATRRTVPELLDMEVRLAQGFLFGAARPVRPAADAPERAVPAPANRLVPRAATR